MTVTHKHDLKNTNTYSHSCCNTQTHFEAQSTLYNKQTHSEAHKHTLLEETAAIETLTLWRQKRLNVFSLPLRHYFIITKDTHPGVRTHIHTHTVINDPRV